MRFLPDDTHLDFIRKRRFAYVLSAILVIGAIVSITMQGLNFGIDFSGGILMEVDVGEKADLAEMRETLSGLDLGEVSLQRIGDEADMVLIRVQKQKGAQEAQQEAISLIRETLGEDLAYRRVEFVGPQVGQELIKDGILAVVFSVLAIVVYIWLRFEWPFAIGAMIALVHDVLTTVGLFSLLQLEFGLTTVAAVLTIAGYSINDTVVSYDRVRENLRKYKKMPVPELLNKSINDMLSRTILTSVTTLLAVLSIFILGGEVLRPFALALIWGILIGTYSSMYVAMPILTLFNIRVGSAAPEGAKPES